MENTIRRSENVRRGQRICSPPKMVERCVSRVSQLYERVRRWPHRDLRAGLRVERSRISLIEMYDYKT